MQKLNPKELNFREGCAVPCSCWGVVEEINNTCLALIKRLDKMLEMKLNHALNIVLGPIMIFTLGWNAAAALLSPAAQPQSLSNPACCSSGWRDASIRRGSGGSHGCEWSVRRSN